MSVACCDCFSRKSCSFTVGKRDREDGEESEEEEDDEEEEEEEDDEEETKEAADFDMGKKSKTKPSDDGVESIRKTLEKTKISSSKGSRVRSLPPYWYEDDNGNKIVTAEQRLPEDTGRVEALIVPGGKQVHIKCFVSNDYLETDQFVEDTPMEERTAKLQVNAREKAVRAFKEANNHDDVFDEFWIDLPFPCEERFYTGLDEDGFYINYKHNTTLVMVLVGSEKAREKKKTPKKYGRKKFAGDTDHEEVELDDDEDIFNMDTGGGNTVPA